MHKIYPHGAIGIKNPTSGTIFKVNGQRFKSFLEKFAIEEEVETLVDPPTV